MSWEEFFQKYGSSIAGSLFFAFQGDFEYTGTVHAVRDHFPQSQNVRIILQDVSCRKQDDTKEWTRFGRSTCTVLRKLTCFQEVKDGVFSLQLDDMHHAFIVFKEAQKMQKVA